MQMSSATLPRTHIDSQARLTSSALHASSILKRPPSQPDRGRRQIFRVAADAQLAGLRDKRVSAPGLPVARGRARSTAATLFRWSLRDAKLLEA